MRRERVTEDELRSAIRAAGHADPAGIEAVVLETAGTYSVIATTGPDAPALENVDWERAEAQQVKTVE